MVNKQLRDESETWKLVSELFNAEALYFNRKPLTESLCPKTLQLEMLAQSHEAVSIHAVASWLEKIQEPKSLRPQSDLECLKSVYEMLRAGQD